MNEFYISQLAPHQQGPEREFYKDKKRREITLDKIFAQREKDKKKRVLKFTSNSKLILIYLSRRRPIRKLRL